ncbi:MAG: SBBP repeat-containing protein [Candidatus Kariarchaeaceae archaeon]
MSDDDEVEFLVIDSSDNIIVVGRNNNLFISKFTSDGRLLGTEDLLWTEDLSLETITIDSNDNLLLLSGSNDALNILKMSPSLELLDNGTISMTRGWPPFAITTDHDDNVIISGTIRAPGTDLQITPGAFDPTFNGGNPSEFDGESDLFVAKFNSELDLLWSTFFGGTGNERPMNNLERWNYGIDLAIDRQNNIILTSSSNSPVLYNQETPTYNTSNNVIVAKFNATGWLLWNRLISGNANEYARSVTTDSADNILITGKTASANYPVYGVEYFEQHTVLSVYVTKYSPDGELLWSTILSGENEDEGYSLVTDPSNNIFISGKTKSKNFATASDTSHSGSNDLFIAKLDNEGSLHWKHTFGGARWEEHTGMRIDSESNIIVAGFTDSDDFPVDSNPNTYDYSFGGNTDGILLKFDSTENKLAWSTRAVIVTNPDLDPDNDELTNREEFIAHTMPNNNDTDGDTMLDGKEVELGLNATLDDADLDYDGDGLPNLFEYTRQYSPIIPDTDGDGMDDEWEYDNRLEPLVDDALDDIDNDGMYNYWEYINGLNPQTNDANVDSDSDGMTNIEEYIYSANRGLNETNDLGQYLGLYANNSDTDGDGMSDGWEANNDLNPFEDDANGNKDGDLFPNWVEYELDNSFLGNLNLFSAEKPIDSIVVVSVLIIPILVLLGYQIRKRRRNKKALKMGYESFPDYQQSLMAGFSSIEEREEAKSKGFLSVRAQISVFALGFKNVDQMLDNWNAILDTTKNEFPEQKIKVLEKVIAATVSPIALHQVEKDQVPLTDKIEHHLDKLNQIISIQESLILLEEDLEFPQFVNFTLDELQTLKETIISTKSSLEEYKSALLTLIDNRKQWFAPWGPLLSFIQVTEDGLPIELAEIANIVRCEDNHAEELIKLLLNENPVIGKYDGQQKIYTKGVDIDSYIKMILSKIREDEFE